MKKHVTKIIIAVMAAAVALCVTAIAFSDTLKERLGGTGVQMEYETKLFNTDEIITVDILMDEDEWNKMLQNAMTEEYYVCDVVINGQTIKNVAIRPKGNTSLSAIASDPDSDRYSLKLEFGHFVEGQTCFGLDKLILNNNYADATNMKEAIIYDMFQYIGAEASLYNYAKVSLNGEYWGVYLALEAVEESFMLRNFGTQDGELYKPDSMEMGGNKSSDSGSGKTPGGMNFPGGDGGFDFDPNNMPNMGGDGSGFNFDPNNMPNMGGDGGFNFDPGSIPNMGDGSGFDPGSMPSMGDGSGFDPGSMPNMGGDGSSGDTSDKDSSSGKGSTSGRGSSGGRGSSSDKSGFSGKGRPSGSSQSGEKTGDGQSGRPDAGSFNMSDFGGKGGFSMGGGGANLNYTGDDLDNYSTIWEGEITATGNSDHKRVVEALKNISEGTDLEKYLDVDNVLKYMAVHTFSVNMDSLSGSMAHNYYLYEYNGQLNIFPWDYNLSLGGMSMGSSGDATDMVNDAIDTPFSGTKFFDKLLENEEYLAKYHEYLRQLVEEYVYGGRFEEVYQRIRSQIDSLVETDPTAFYSYEDYEKAAEILYQVINLRAQSIDGQLNGTIPSTDTEQNKNKTTFVDASGIDAKAMGSFNMGGFSGDNAVKQGRRTRSVSQNGEDGGNVFENLDFSNFDFSKLGGFGGGSEGRGSFPGGRSGQQADKTVSNNIIIYGGCFVLMLLMLVTLRVVRRKRRI